MTKKKTKKLPRRVPAKKSQPKPARKQGSLPQKIFAQASPKSIGGVSMFEMPAENLSFSATIDQPVTTAISADNVLNFFSEDRLLREAAQKLREAGFDILQVSPTSINISGSKTTYERAFQTKIEGSEKPVIKELGKVTTAEFLDSPDT